MLIDNQVETGRELSCRVGLSILNTSRQSHQGQRLFKKTIKLQLNRKLRQACSARMPHNSPPRLSKSNCLGKPFNINSVWTKLFCTTIRKRDWAFYAIESYVRWFAASRLQQVLPVEHYGKLVSHCVSTNAWFQKNLLVRQHRAGFRELGYWERYGGREKAKGKRKQSFKAVTQSAGLGTKAIPRMLYQVSCLKLQRVTKSCRLSYSWSLGCKKGKVGCRGRRERGREDRVDSAQDTFEKIKGREGEADLAVVD